MKLLARFGVSIILLIVCSQVVHSQAFGERIHFLDYNLAVPATMACDNDHVVICYESGFAVVFNSEFQYVRNCTELDKHFIEEVFSWSGRVWALTYDKKLFQLNGDRFTFIKQLDGYYFRTKQDQLLVLVEGVVHEMIGASGTISFESKFRVPVFERSVIAFAIELDTVVYAIDSSSTAYICDLEGNPLASIHRDEFITRFHSLPNGDVVIQESLASTCVILNGTLSRPSVREFKFQGVTTEYSHALNVLVDNRVALIVIGLSFSPKTPSLIRKDGFSTGVPLFNVGSVSQNYSAATFNGTQWIVAGRSGKIATLSSGSLDRKVDHGPRPGVYGKHLFIKPIVQPSNAVLMTGALAFYGADTGGENDTIPILFDRAVSPDSWRVIRNHDSVESKLVYYYDNPDGSTLAVLENAILFKEKDRDEWTDVTGGVRLPISIVQRFHRMDSERLMMPHNYGMDISTDGGRAWKQDSVTAAYVGYESHVSFGDKIYTHYFFHDDTRTTIVCFDINNPSNVIARSGIPVFNPFTGITTQVQFETADSSEVRFVCGIKGYNMNSPFPNYCNRIVTYTWKPLSNQLDSVSYELKNLIPFDYFSTSYHDTTFIWIAEENRLLRFHSGQCLQDVRLRSREYRVPDFPRAISSSVLAPDGKWWFFIPSRDFGWCIDLTKAHSVSSLESEEIQTQSENMMVYPNPSGNKLTIELKGELAMSGVSSSLALVDINGKRVLNIADLDCFSSGGTLSCCVEVDVSSITPGVYFVLCDGDSNRSAKRVVIQR